MFWSSYGRDSPSRAENPNAYWRQRQASTDSDADDDQESRLSKVTDFYRETMAKDDYISTLIPHLTWSRRDNLDFDVADQSTQAMDYMLAATDQDASGNASEAFMLITGVIGKIERQMVRGVQKTWKATLTGTDVLFPDNTLPGQRESLAALHSIREPFPLNPASSSLLCTLYLWTQIFPYFSRVQKTRLLPMLQIVGSDVWNVCR
ncbi:hypothetical protein MP228_010541 [Amoeboaphelidium protococcarum]|nr:hypothetical protein MP228_010541 [Amoeboaphelidium protococcarum]